MENKSLSIIIQASKEIIDDANNIISKENNEKCQVVQRKNLGGEAPTWMLAASLSLQVLTLLLEYLKHRASTKKDEKVSKITVGDIEVENPTPELLKQLTEQIEKRFNPSISDSGK
jgi:hypothetical protein